MTVLGGAEWRWDQLLLGLRLFSAVHAVGAVVLIGATVRRVTGSGAAATVGTLGLLAVAQLFNIQVLATNDAWTLLLGAGLVYALVRVLTSSEAGWATRWPDTLVAATLLGLGLLTKGTMLTAVPVVALVLLVAGWRGGGTVVHRLAPAVVGGLVAVATGGWYYLRNIVVYGQIQSSNSGSVRAPEPFDGYSMAGYLEASLWHLVRTFWGSRRAALELAPVHVWALTAALLVCTVVVLVRSRHRLTMLLLLVFPAGICGLLLVHGWRIWFGSGRIVGLQGRYLFTTLAIFALVLGLAWLLAGAGVRSRRLRAAGTLGLSVGLVVLSGTTWAGSVESRWGADGDAWSSLTTTWPVPGAALVLLALLASAAVLTAGGCAAVASLWTPAPPPAPPAGRTRTVRRARPTSAVAARHAR
jgi:hypothetical protein